MVEDKYPYHWMQADSNGVYDLKKRKPTDRELASLISLAFDCNCTELDVHMARGKHKERIKILKAGNPDPEDFLDMVNYYRDKEDYIHPKRQWIKFTELKM